MVDGRSVSEIFFPSLPSEVHLPVQLFCKRDCCQHACPKGSRRFCNCESLAISEDYIANSLVGGGDHGILGYVPVKISLFSNSRGLNVCKEQLRPGVSNSEIGWSAKGASTLGGGGGSG